MTQALTLETMSPGLCKGVERAQREPEGRFHALAHLIDVPALMRAYRGQRAAAAVGVDGVTKEAYGRHLESNLQDLHARLKAKRYRHQPIRRVHIPKGPGTTRPIGISAFEDKMVQDAVREVLEAIYERDCLDCSYGFRPGRWAHKASDLECDRGFVPGPLPVGIDTGCDEDFRIWGGLQGRADPFGDLGLER